MLVLMLGYVPNVKEKVNILIIIVVEQLVRDAIMKGNNLDD